MKPTLIQPPSKPANHHNYSSSGHQPQNQTWKHQTQPTKTQHQWPSPLKPITNDPPHHRERHGHSDLTTTHPITDLITDLHHKRGIGRRFVPSLHSTFTSGTLMLRVKVPRVVLLVDSTNRWVAPVGGWRRYWVALVSGWRHHVLGEKIEREGRDSAKGREQTAWELLGES